MKICLSFKHLFVIFGLGLCTSLYAVASTGVAPLCRRLLKEPLTAQQIEQTIESLARLKLTVDLNKRSGADDIQNTLLEQQFVEKKQELARDLEIGESALNQKLRGYINHAQKGKEREQDQIHRDKKVQTEAIAKTLPDYQLTQRWNINRLDDGILSPNGENLFTISKNPNQIQGIKLSTGDITILEYDSVLALRDRILLHKDSKWSSLDANNMTLTALGADLPTKMDSIEMRASPKKDAVLFYPSAMSNAPKDRFQYQLLGHNGKLIDSGDIQTGFVVTAVPFIGDRYWIVQSSERLFKFFPQSKLMEPLTAGVSFVFAIPDTNKIIVNQKNGVMTLIDLDSNQTESRTFTNVAYAFFANKEIIWVAERNNNVNAHFHLIKVSDFTNSSEPLPDQPNFVINEIPGTEWFALHDKFQANPTPPAIYHSNDLAVPLFTYGNKYNPGTGEQIARQWVTQDGKRIVTTVNRRRDLPTIDIWERK